MTLSKKSNLNDGIKIFSHKNSKASFGSLWTLEVFKGLSHPEIIKY